MPPSLLAKSVKETLKEIFPQMEVREEVFVPYKGQRLFFDYHLPSLNLYVEVQGQQHSKFSAHFHGDALAFQAARLRDRLKKEWCDLSEVALVCVNFDEIPISGQDLLNKIMEAQQNG